MLVREYRSAAELESDARRMLPKGWRIAAQSTRARRWSIWTGFYTNKGITTVTWVRYAAP